MTVPSAPQAPTPHAHTDTPPAPLPGRRAGAKPLSNTEASRLRSELIMLLGPSFDDLDRLLSVTNRNKAQAHIWQTVDDREIELIADAWIGWGKKSARGAVAVRAIVANWARYQALLILGPRMLETVGFYADNGIAIPGLSARRPRRAAPAAPTAARVPVVVDSAPAFATPAPQPAAPVPATMPAAAAPAPPAAPVSTNPYADAEAAQRAHAAKVSAMHNLASEEGADSVA